MANYFEELRKIDCSAHVEKKGGFSYLSWPYAIGELLTRHPEATWRVVETAEGSPAWCTQNGWFVKVAVTVNGIERTQIHPILDGRNQPIKEPNAFHVNTSIQRALVKAIALHGLGLYIYAGEDLPTDAEAQHDIKPSNGPNAGVQESLTPEQRERVKRVAATTQEYLDQDDVKGAVDYKHRAELDGAEENAAYWMLFSSYERAAMKLAHEGKHDEAQAHLIRNREKKMRAAA